MIGAGVEINLPDYIEVKGESLGALSKKKEKNYDENEGW